MGTPRDSFSAIEAAEIAGVPYRTLDYWATTGFIAPSLADANGRGSERRYAFDDLVALRVARELREAGISVQALRIVVEKLRTEKHLRNPLAHSRLLAVGSDVELVTNCDDVMSILLKPGQAAFSFMFDLARTVREMKKEIRKRPRATSRKGRRVA